MKRKGSYRQILRSSSIVGGASAINIAIGLVRIKVAAVLLGPSGIGLIGLLTSLTGTASAIAGLGVGNAGTRQIAEAVGQNDASAIATARRALFWVSLALAIVGMLIFWSLRRFIADGFLANAALSGEIGWLAISVAATVAAASQTALLTGLRQLGDLARVSVLSALLSSVLGIGALKIWGEGGVICFILIGPLSTFLLGHLFVARLPKVHAAQTPLSALMRQWRALIVLGTAFMVASLMAVIGQLVVKTLVQRELGASGLGYFQAAATISMTYIGFVLTAMGTDFYPRLSGAVHESATATSLVNEQTEVALLLAGPILMAMMSLAPWVIELLYSKSFSSAATVLRWQICGDVLKIASWPLGFLMLAKGDGRAYMLIEFVGVSAFVLLTLLLLPALGVAAAGISFFGMYLVYLPVVYFVAHWRFGFRWERVVPRQIGVLVVCVGIVFMFSEWNRLTGAIVGFAFFLILSVQSFVCLTRASLLPTKLHAAVYVARVFLNKMGLWRD